MADHPPRRLRHVISETPQETAARLHAAMAEAMREYRNVFGVAQARCDVLMQMYVLGLISIDDTLASAMLLHSFGADGKETEPK